MEIVFLLLIGAVSGWIAGQIMKGGGFGLIGNIIIGILGAFIGGFLLTKLGITIGSGVFGLIITSVIGAVVLLFIVGLVKK